MNYELAAFIISIVSLVISSVLTIFIIFQTRRIANEQREMTKAMEAQQRNSEAIQIKLAQRTDKRALYGVIVQVYRYCEWIDTIKVMIKTKSFTQIKGIFELTNKEIIPSSDSIREALIVGEWYVPKHMRSCIKKLFDNFSLMIDKAAWFSMMEVLTEDEKEAKGEALDTIIECAQTILGTKMYINDMFEKELSL